MQRPLRVGHRTDKGNQYVASPVGLVQRLERLGRTMSNREIYTQDEREIVDELDREVDRKGGLFALVACLAIAAGLALATVISIWGSFG